MQILKNILYALLLGVGMAACLAETGTEEREAGAAPAQEANTAPAPEASPDPAAFIIGKGRIGSVRLGMPVEELRNQVPPHFLLTDTLLHQEGQAYTAYRLRQAGTNTFLLIEQECHTACLVWRIGTESPEYKTENGLGPGSTLAEVQQHHTITSISTSDAGLVAVAEKDGISFVLDTSGLPRNRPANLKPADLPATTRVNRIFIY